MSNESSSSEVEADPVAVGWVPLALRLVRREAAGDRGEGISSAFCDFTAVPGGLVLAVLKSMRRLYHFEDLLGPWLKLCADHGFLTSLR